jgi:hypothetical protein
LKRLKERSRRLPSGRFRLSMEPEWGPAAMVDLPREDVQIGMGAAVAMA